LTCEIILSARSRRQLFTALRWWYRHRDKAPGAFDEELDRTWALLREVPDAGILVRSSKRTIRRLLMPRVRYYVYYRLTSTDTIEVVAFWHASRRPPRL
jgi:plasmid stabilization system protein ParE